MVATNTYETRATKTRRVETALPSESGCACCRGYLGDDYCVDIFSDTGEVAIAVLRCTQCGTLLDPVILPHRFKDERVAA